MEGSELTSGGILGSYDSNTFVFDPPCDCSLCHTQFYKVAEQRLGRWAYTSVLTDEEAREILAGYVTAIEADRQYLIAAIKKHGDEMLSRWRKRTRTKRAALLQLAEPNLPHDKAFIADLEFAGVNWNVIRQEYRRRLLLCSVDIHTLATNPSMFIGLLHHRASRLPQEWVRFDSDQLDSSWTSGLLDVNYNASCVYIHGPGYGGLTEWNSAAVHQCYIMGFPRGQLALEAQAMLMSFLRRAVEHLLNGVEAHGLDSAVKWNELVQAGLRKSGDSASWSVYMNRPFSAPPVLDVDALVSQAKARVDATGDHLWLLQTEPSYMKRCVDMIHQLQPTHFLFPKETIRSALGTWEFLLDIDRHWFWRGILEEFEHIQGICSQYNYSIRPGFPLAKDVNATLGAVEKLLLNCLDSSARSLQIILARRPGFEHLYDLKYAGDICAKRPAMIKRSYTPLILYKKERLWWCLMQLLGDVECRARFHYATVFDMLERHLESASAEERGRLDGLLYEHLSDHVTIIEILWAIRMHYPRPAFHAHDADGFKSRFASKYATAKKLDCMCSVGRVLDKFQTVPPPSGPKDRAWLQAFNAMHRASQEVWREVSKVHELWFKDRGFAEKEIRASMQALSHWNSADYESRLEARRKEVLSEMEKRNAHPQPTLDLFLPLPSTEDDAAKLQIRYVKVKVKTRSEKHTPESIGQTLHATGLIETVPTVTKITLAKRALVVLRNMFPLTADERQVTVEWETFVLAMEEAGFAAKNGGGSIVVFEQKDGPGKIIFHRPHPVPKIDPVMLQSMGRRMNKWFGWTRNTFALAGK